MGNEYRKIRMNKDTMWELYHQGFDKEKNGFALIDDATLMKLIYPEMFYKLWNGKPLKIDHWRKDDGALKRAFCQDKASSVKGSFAYVCGTFCKVEGICEFLFSFDTERDPDECLPYILLEYSWDKRDSAQADALPEEIIKDAKILHGYGKKGFYDYDGVEYFVVVATDERYHEIMLDYYANLGRLINAANAQLDDFDRWKEKWKTKAFEGVAPEIEKALSGYTTTLGDEEMEVKYKDAFDRIITWGYRFDYIGWQAFLDKFGEYLPEGTVDEEGYPAGFNDDIRCS